MYVDLERFLYYVDLAFPNLDKTIISNIKAGRRAIPDHVIIGTLNYMVDRPCSYLIPDFYHFALDFNFQRKNNHLSKCLKYYRDWMADLNDN